MFHSTVGGHTVASLPPDALLHIEAGLIGREILQADIAMGREESVYRIAPMPHRAINVQPDYVAAQRAAKVTQGGEKALVVAMRMAQQATTPQQRRDPPEDIQAVPMGAAGGDSEACAVFRPAAAYAGMEREARFVFEDNGLARGQCGEPFFRLVRKCRASSDRAWT